MKGTYRKSGRAVTFLVARGEQSIIETREEGISRSLGGRFSSASARADADPPGDSGALIELARSLMAGVASPVQLERLQIVMGSSEQRVESDGGERIWRETHVRLHASLLVRRLGLRVPLLRGGPFLESIDAKDWRARLTALAGLREPARAAGSIALEAPVVARIAAALAASGHPVPEVRLVQQPHRDYPFDGDGARVRGGVVSAPRASWPNRYRPSYRSPSVRAVLHAAIESERQAPVPPVAALEVLGAVRLADGAVLIDALCGAGDGSFPARFEIGLAGLAFPAGSDPDPVWFPFGAGAWGRLMVAEGARIRPWPA